MESVHKIPLSLVRDLFNDPSCWDETAEAVKLSIKSLLDVIVNQDQAIQELQKEIHSKPNRSELNAGLALKSNISDLTRSIADIHLTRLSKDEATTIVDAKNLALQGKIESQLSELSNAVANLKSQLKNQLFTVDVKAIQETQDSRIQSIENKMNKFNTSFNKINEDIEGMATKESVANAMTRKINKSDLNSLIEQTIGATVEKSLQSTNEKIDNSEKEFKAFKLSTEEKYNEFFKLAADNESSSSASFGKLSDSIKEYEENQRNNIEKFKSEVATKIKEHSAQIENVESYKDQIDHQGQQANMLEASLKVIKEDKINASAKCEQLESRIKSINEEFNKKVTDLEKCLVGINSDFESQIANKINKKEAEGLISSQIENLQTDIHAQLSDKIEKKEHQIIMEQLKEEINNTIENEVVALSSKFQLKFVELGKSINIELIREEQNRVLSTKADKNDVSEALSLKANASDIDYLKELITSNRVKPSSENIDKLRVDYMVILQDLKKELLLKASLKDVIDLLDIKANVKEVNTAFEDARKEIVTKVGFDELSKLKSDQQLINEALCSQNCVGRWIWKSGELKMSNIIWDVQSVNTCPDNFIWENGKPCVLVEAPGLYELMMGFYGPKKPAIQLLVNDEPVLSAVNTASYVVHHNSGKMKGMGMHTSGNIAGLTLLDFISLPARAKISFAYNGEGNSEGFFGLRKL